MTKQTISSGLLTVNEVAEYFGCNVSTIWRWAKNGTLSKPLKIAGITRWRRSDIEALTAAEAAA